MGVGVRERLLDVTFGVLTVLPAFFDTPATLHSDPTWGLSWYLAPAMLAFGVLGLVDALAEASLPAPSDPSEPEHADDITTTSTANRAMTKRERSVR